MSEAKLRRPGPFGFLSLVVLSLLVSVAPVAARERAAPVSLNVQVSGAPAMGGAVSVTVSAVPRVNCDRLQVNLDLPPELTLAGGAASWAGPAQAGTPVRIAATVRIEAAGILPVGATVTAVPTGTVRPILGSANIYLEVPPLGRAAGRVLPQSPVLVGAFFGGAAQTRVTRSSAGRQAPTANLSGKFFYKQGGDGALVPVAGCRVRVLDGATEVASGTTGADGGFAFVVPRGATYRVEVRSEATDGSKVTVYRSLPSNVHAYQKEVNVAADAADVVMADETVTSYPASATTANYRRDQSGAFGILDAVRQGQRYVEARGNTIGDVKAVWGANVHQDASYYDSGTNAFYIRGQKNRPGQWQPDVVLHEYGHYVLHNFSRDASQGGSHNPNQQDQAFSWSEGWANFFMGAVQNDPVYQGLANFNIETDLNGWGKQNEEDVAGILWDVFDGTNDAAHNDTLALGIASIWRIVTGNKPVTLQEFVNFWLYDPARAQGEKSLGNEEKLLRICRGHRAASRPGVYNVRIVFPAPGGSVNAGPFNNPKKFTLLVETRWDHDTLLTDATSFTVQVSDNVSKRVTPAFTVRNRQYELDVRRPPEQPANGLYNLIVFARHNESSMSRAVAFTAGAWVTTDTTAPGAVDTASIREDGARYADPGGLELALIIDSSGSMSGNDPSGLRKKAAKLLIDTAEEGDAIAVVDFDSSARVWAGLTTITGRPGEVTPDRTALKAAVDKVDSSGGTNIEAGLQFGYNQLNTSTSSLQKAAILLTDGQGSYNGVATAAFASKGWPVFSIGLTGYVDENLLRGIATQTGGQYYKAPSDQQLVEIFTQLRGAPRGETTVATERGTLAASSTVATPVMVDGTLTSVTFSTSWSTGTLSLELIRPDGTTVAPGDPGVSRGVGSSFEFYTVAQPAAGAWSMRTTNNTGSALSYVNLASGPSPLSTTLFSVDSSYVMGSLIRLAISLYEGGNPVTGATVTATVTKPGGLAPAAADVPDADPDAAWMAEEAAWAQRSAPTRAGRAINTVTLFDDGAHNDGAANDGIYANDYTNTDVAGDYTIDITVTGKTASGQDFNRVVTYRVNVVTGAASNISASPSSKNFGTLWANASTAIQAFTISTGLVSSFRVDVTPGDLTATGGDVIPASAVSASPGSLTIASASSATLEVSVNVPKDTKPGTYTGVLTLEGAANRRTVSITVTVQAETDPPTITDVAPADGSVLVNPTPETFTMKVADGQSGIERSGILVLVDGTPVRFQFDSTTGVVTFAAQIDDVPVGGAPETGGTVADAFGPGEHTVLLRVADVGGNVTETSYKYRVAAPPAAYARGLNLLSMSATLATPAGDNPFGLAELQAAWWRPDGTGYVYYGQPEFPAFSPTTAFWARFQDPAALMWPGTVPNAQLQQAARVPLKAGWNLVPNPFVDAVPWRPLEVKVARGAEEKTLADAQAAGWVEDYAWGWQQDGADPLKGRYVMVYDANVLPGVVGQMDAWRGFFMLAYADCELILPPPSGPTRVVARRDTASSGWSMQLQARSRDGVGSVTLGVSPNRAMSAGLPPEPPAGSSPVRAALTGPAGPLAVDVRTGSALRYEWEVVVDPGAAQPVDVTLTCPDVRALPKDVALTLIDAATGARRYLRTSGAYTFRAEGPRRFRVVAERRAGPAVSVTGLELAPLRGDAKMLRYVLSTPAVVDAQLLSPSGRTVATVTRARASEAGANQVAWSGQVAPGIYLLTVTATTEEGASAQAVRPVLVTR